MILLLMNQIIDVDDHNLDIHFKLFLSPQKSNGIVNSNNTLNIMENITK